MDQEFTEFSESDKSLKHENPLCYLCLAGIVATSCSLKQEVAGSNNVF